MIYTLIRRATLVLFRVGFRIEVTNLDELPPLGPVILAANHQSFSDSMFLPVVISRRVTFLAKAEYFDQWHTRLFMGALGQIPIRRGTGPESIRAIAMATELLNEGAVLALYPEGTRSLDGMVHRGHAGAARLALSTGAAVVPVGIRGTEDVQPVGSRVLKPFRRVCVQLGPARYIGPADVEAAGSKKLALRSFTDSLMADIALLSGRDYVDTYLKAPEA